MKGSTPKRNHTNVHTVITDKTFFDSSHKTGQNNSHERENPYANVLSERMLVFICVSCICRIIKNSFISLKTNGDEKVLEINRSKGSARTLIRVLTDPLHLVISRTF